MGWGSRQKAQDTRWETARPSQVGLWSATLLIKSPATRHLLVSKNAGSPQAETMMAIHSNARSLDRSPAVP